MNGFINLGVGEACFLEIISDCRLLCCVPGTRVKLTLYNTTLRNIQRRHQSVCKRVPEPGSYPSRSL